MGYERLHGSKASAPEPCRCVSLGKVHPPDLRSIHPALTGIEGRISVLQRVYGLDRCPDHGEDGLARWIGWGIITANLERIARTLVERATAQSAIQPAKAA